MANVIVSIGVSAKGNVGNVLVYSNIVPDQNPAYSEINVSQSPSWLKEEPDQSANWTKITA